MIDGIIRMAREAGAAFPSVGIWHRFDSHEELEHFAKLVAEHEREACAKVAEQYGPKRPIILRQPGELIKGRWEGEQAASSGIAAAIRARGTT